MAFHRLTHEAKLRYGVAHTRPQDNDATFKVMCRRNNHGFVPVPPMDYQNTLHRVSSEFNVKISQVLPCHHVPKVEWIDNARDLRNAASHCMHQNLVGCDFEFHNMDVYDAFICVTSLSAGKRTFVVDCLYENRCLAIQQISNILKDDNISKILCGFDNDIVRLTKDWECFPVNVIDVQDLFKYWKNEHFEECMRLCLPALKQKLSGKSNLEIEKFLTTYDKPSLEFLLNVFLKPKFCKSKVAQVSDFRRRPLHSDLLEYSGYDAYGVLQVFQHLVLTVGQEGVHFAVRVSKDRLHALVHKSSGPPSYKCLRGYVDLPNGYAVQQWRNFLAKNLDKNPALLISDQNVLKLIKELENDEAVMKNELKLASVLRNVSYQDDCSKAGRLLLLFLEPGQANLKRMKDIVCHRCNSRGHSANFCVVPMTHEEEKESKRHFRNRTENKDANIKQYNRRWLRYCEKRQLDPAVAKKPWQSML